MYVMSAKNPQIVRVFHGKYISSVFIGIFVMSNGYKTSAIAANPHPALII
jgi:hypothetical protein